MLRLMPRLSGLLPAATRTAPGPAARAASRVALYAAVAPGQSVGAFATSPQQCLSRVATRTYSVALDDLDLASLLPEHGDMVPDPDEVAAARASRPEHVTCIKFNAKAFDHVILDSYIEFVRRSAKCFDLEHSGRIPLPTHIARTTLLKSPHVYKKHRVQVRHMSAKTAEVFLSYVQSHVPAGVAVRIKTETQESLKAALDDAEN